MLYTVTVVLSVVWMRVDVCQMMRLVDRTDERNGVCIRFRPLCVLSLVRDLDRATALSLSDGYASPLACSLHNIWAERDACILCALVPWLWKGKLLDNSHIHTYIYRTTFHLIYTYIMLCKCIYFLSRLTNRVSACLLARVWCWSESEMIHQQLKPPGRRVAWLTYRKRRDIYNTT